MGLTVGRIEAVAERMYEAKRAQVTNRRAPQPPPWSELPRTVRLGWVQAARREAVRFV